MKLTTLVLFAAMLHVSAASIAQKVTLKGNNIPIKEVFKEIERQTGYNILWRTGQFNPAAGINVNFKEASLEQVMSQCLSVREFDFVIRDQTIAIVSRNNSKILDKIIGYFKGIDIKGKVTDKEGRPLAGATVSIKHGAKVVTTDVQGNFILVNIDADEIVSVSYIGFESREFKASALSDLLAVILQDNQTNLNEVAVVSTGYQTLKKSQLTGAYSTINRDTYLQTVPVNGNMVGNLEGRLPGLILNLNQSRNSWADPNNTSPFTIRGVSTFQAIKKPLIVLNGYPTEIDIESINPYDIESITILKDAASAAIYGVRASNGVVVINTKKGTAGKPVFHFTTALTLKPKPDYNKLNLLKGRDYIDFEKASALNDIVSQGLSKEYIDQVNGTYTPVFSITDDLYSHKITAAEAEKAYNELAAYDNTEDYKKIFLQNQLFQTYNFNVSGGSAGANYFFGVNHQDNKGTEKFSDFNKTNINFRGSFEFSKRISLDVQTVYTNSNNNQSTIPDYMAFRPYQHFLDANGTALPSYFAPINFNFYGFGDSYGTISSAGNQENMVMGLYDEMYYPYKEMFESSNKLRSDLYRAQGNLKVNILSGLNLELGGVYERQIDKTITTASENAYETRIMLNYFAKMDPVTGKPIFGIPQGGVNKTQDNSITSYTLRAQLTYNKLLKERHDVSFLAGVERRQNSSTGKLSTQFGYNSNTLSIKPVDLSLLGNFNYYPDFINNIVSGVGGYVADQTQFSQYFNETSIEDRFLSYYVNGAYTYNQKYTVTGSLRIDQSNLFGLDSKFRYTPLWSTGLSWNLHHEDFMKGISWLDELKLRVAAGYNGNIKKGSGPFNLLQSSINSYVPNPVIGYSILAPKNNELRWEKTFNFNTGVDFSIFGNRVSGAVDYYIKRGADIFSQIGSDPTFGFNNLLTNNASIENKGIDLSISTLNVQRGRFFWRTQVTGSFNSSKVLKVRNTFNGFFNFTRAGGAENIEGHPMNSVLVLDYAGLNANGQPQVRDQNGNLVVLSFSPQVDVPLSALKFAGVNDPKYALGFNNQFGFGDFSLSVLLMYYGGNVALIQPPSVFDQRPVNGAQNFWKNPGDEKTTMIPGFGGAYGTPDYIDNRYAYQFGSQFVRKMDYIAVRDITLTYNLKDKWLQALGLRQTKLIFQVQNPYKYVFSGNDIDPETLNYISGQRGLPVVPAYTFSLSTSF